MKRVARRISFTREGVIFTLLTFPVGMAAINTGNNMLYLVLGMLLSIIAVNGFMSESTVKGVQVTAKRPDWVHANEPLTTFVEMHNQKRWLPSYLLRVRFDSAAGKKSDLQSQDGFCLKISHGQACKARLKTVFPFRGAYRLTGFVLATRFPFGLFEKSRLITAPMEVVVYPALQPAVTLAAGSSRVTGDLEQNRRGLGDDLYGLRHYQSSDDARHIHWKLSAKAGRPIVREFSDSGRERALICFDTRLKSRSEPKPGLRNAAFEQAVSTAASLVHDAFESGLEFGLWTPEKIFAPEEGEAHFHRVMRYLAAVAPHSGVAEAAPPEQFTHENAGSVHWVRAGETS